MRRWVEEVWTDSAQSTSEGCKQLGSVVRGFAGLPLCVRASAIALRLTLACIGAGSAEGGERGDGEKGGYDPARARRWGQVPV